MPTAGCSTDLLLRGEWGFDGTVVSDYFAVRQLEEYHHVAANGREAAALALTSGIDVELPGTDCYAGAAAGRSSDGCGHPTPTSTVPSRRVLDAKFRLGLFERRSSTPTPSMDTRTAPQIELARGSRPTAWCCCATTACCRCAARRRSR